MDVRLITGSYDPYVWDYPQERERLFQKHLSKHAMGAYVVLIGEVGKTIHAVPVRANKTVGAASRASDAVASNTARIHRLEERCLLLEREHARAVEESIQWQLRTAESLQLKSSAEVELAIARAELHSAQDVIQELRCQLAASSSTAQESAVLEAYSANGVDLILGHSQKVRLR
jgi:hypothetical protein